MTKHITQMAETLGRLLNERTATGRVHAAASRAEPVVRAALAGLLLTLQGVRLVGLDHELKSLASIDEKFVRLGDDAHLRDTLRYTLVLGGMNFTSQVVAAADYLAKRGFRCARLQATEGEKGWARGYIGVNSNWMTHDGTVFEIQFHTELTWYAKTESHDAYEVWRKDMSNPAKREANTRRYQECFTAGAAKLGVEQWKLGGVRQTLDRWFAQYGSPKG